MRICPGCIITKNYELANDGYALPGRDLYVSTIEPDTVTDASDGIEAGDYADADRRRR